MRTQGAGNLWRIMTSNVWADVFGNPVEGRDTQLAQVYEHYLPDVLCLQEMHPNWHASRLKPQLAQRYDEYFHGLTSAEKCLASVDVYWTAAPREWWTCLHRTVRQEP